MKKIIAHIDEFGTNSTETDKDGVSSHFLLCATLIREEKIDESKRLINEIRKKYFQGSEIKSSNIKRKHHNRRLQILNSLNKIDFVAYVIVIDKKEINSKGLNYKHIFYKYFNKELVNDLRKLNSEITFISDEIGTNEYRESFKKYIQNSITQYDLFNEEKVFSFNDSKESDLVQLSDFIVGSLAKYFDSKHFQENSTEYIELLKDKLNVKFWPNKAENYLKKQTEDETFNPKIAEISTNLALEYVTKNIEKNDNETKAQILILRHLMLIQKISPNYSFSTYELIEKIEKELNQKYTVRLFRKNVIGKLRDNNVIIVSSSKGYKLPVNKYDLIEFVNRYNGILQPMLSRMKKCRDTIMLGSMKEIDILKYPEYNSLKEIINLIK